MTDLSLECSVKTQVVIESYSFGNVIDKCKAGGGNNYNSRKSGIHDHGGVHKYVLMGGMQVTVGSNLEKNVPYCRQRIQRSYDIFTNASQHLTFVVR